VKVPENNDKPLASGPIYVIPKGGLFDVCLVTALFCRDCVLRHAALCRAVLRGKAVARAFVVVNLVDRANRTHKWYLETFKDDYPDRFRLIPSVW
jgi:hypothetical protein